MFRFSTAGLGLCVGSWRKTLFFSSMSDTPLFLYKWESDGSYASPAPNFPINIGRDNYNNLPIMMHTHDFLEIAIVTGGQGDYQTPETSYAIRRGDVFLVPLGSYHKYGPPGQLQVSNVF